MFWYTDFPFLLSILFFFLLGTIVGSFLNVVVLRYEKGEQAVAGRSHCMACNKTLAWYELIPIFSYIFQLGKCRGCKAKLSIQYPLVELGTGILFVLILVHFSPYPYTFPYAFTSSYPYPYPYPYLALHLAIWSLFMVITVYDSRTKLIPNRFSYTLAGLAFMSMFIEQGNIVMPSLSHILAGPALFLPFYTLWKVSDGRWIGLGDGKLALGIGWFLGLAEGGTAILFAFWIGAGVSVLVIFLQKLMRQRTGGGSKESALTLKSEIPFGPYLVLGTLIVYIMHFNMYAYLL